MNAPTVVSVAAVPILWSALGYPFEAASMVAGVGACAMVRIYIGANRGTRQGIVVDLSVTALTLLFTAGAIISQRPTPFFALLVGTGFGGLGAGIIKIAVRYVTKLDGFAADSDDVADDEAIRRRMIDLEQIPTMPHPLKLPGQEP